MDKSASKIKLFFFVIVLILASYVLGYFTRIWTASSKQVILGTMTEEIVMLNNRYKVSVIYVSDNLGQIDIEDVTNNIQLASQEFYASGAIRSIHRRTPDGKYITIYNEQGELERHVFEDANGQARFLPLDKLQKSDDNSTK